MTAAASATTKAPAIAFTAPSSPRVFAAPAPLMTAPRMTKIPQKIAAFLKLIIRVPTAVPKTFAASLAPSDHPRNKPLVRKMANMAGSYNMRLMT